MHVMFCSFWYLFIIIIIIIILLPDLLSSFFRWCKNMNIIVEKFRVISSSAEHQIGTYASLFPE
jgi:hypothetical protein